VTECLNQTDDSELTNQISHHAATHEFRSRFHRSIVGPTPFGTFTENQTASTTTPFSTSGSTQENTIDPHLATNASGSAANGTKSEPISVST
jgi:hypothetical protein